MRWFFLFFFGSGFCGLVYQVVWLRLSMASFGVNAPTISTVLSVFMGGLGIGSLAAGYWVRRRSRRSDRYFLKLYALSELLIGVLSVAVAPMLMTGQRLFRTAWSDIAWGSLGHYLAAGGWISLALLPCTILMGATIPLAMAVIQRRYEKKSATSFSFLYLANVAGATVGTAISAFVLIELLGLRATAWSAAGVNLLIAAGAFALSSDPGRRKTSFPQPAPKPAAKTYKPLVMLFFTGLIGMAMQVAWVRLYIPYVGTTVYAFAGILVVYLSSGAAGTWVYRRMASKIDLFKDIASLWLLLATMALLPLWSAVPGMLEEPVAMIGLLLVLVGTAPFAAVLGFLTPMLIDEWSSGEPERAAKAYAVNILGSILGPLASGFLLMPILGARTSILVLFFPAALLGLFGGKVPRKAALGAGLAVFFLATGWLRSDYGWPEGTIVLRDYEATVTASNPRGYIVLKVNGVGMTTHDPATKFMAHLPMAFLAREPKNSLAIAFGMGTTFRSLASWGRPVTAVDLVPSVPALYGVFYADAAQTMPGNRIVIDDGRRFLARSEEKFDVITVDPPPPITAAGSSMLYSVEFLERVKENLREDGILQHWMPIRLESPTGASIAGAIREVFPHVRMFRGYNGGGTHFLASRTPIPKATARQLTDRMPKAARIDLLEWSTGTDAAQIFELVLKREIPLASLDRFDVAPLRDDRPFNEYFFLRAPGMALH